jgi:tetratricopeptide (TPR) repeat protein
MAADLRHDVLLVRMAEALRARTSGRLLVTRGSERIGIDLRQGRIEGVEVEPGEGADRDPEEPMLLGELDLTGDPVIAQAAARERLLLALTWTDASCTLSEGEDRSGDPPLQLSAAEVLAEALPLVRDPAVIRAALGDLDRVLGLAFDPAHPRSLSLTPTEGYLLSRIDGTSSAREVLQLIPMDAEETERSLLSLLFAGLVEYLDVPARPAVPIDEQAPPLELDLGLDEEGTPAAPEPPLPSPGPPSTLSPAELQAARQEIEDAHQSKVANRNHFEVLELDRSADAAAVKAAYFRLAKRFHPDAHRDSGVDDLRDKLKAVFVRLGAAYEVLGNPRKRGDYESSLPRHGFTPPRSTSVTSVAPRRPEEASAPPASSEWEDPLSEEDAALREAEILAKAQRLISEEHYWDAIQVLEAVLATLSPKRQQKGRLLLALAYAKNPKWLRRAEEIAQAVTKESPANFEAYLVLAKVYKAGGLESRAASMYRKVLELKPGQEEAREALEGPAKAMPLLKRLFRKP